MINVGQVDPEILDGTQRCVEELFHCDVARWAPLPVPADGFDARRNQYSSVAFMMALARTEPADVDRVIGVTKHDLFIPMLTFVFGQAQLGGRLALVSIARLRQEFYGAAPEPGLTALRVRKEVGHELGHTMGLIHCPDRTCVMSLATSIQEVDRRTPDFCGSCRKTVDRAVSSGREI